MRLVSVSGSGAGDYGDKASNNNAVSAESMDAMLKRQLWWQITKIKYYLAVNSSDSFVWRWHGGPVACCAMLENVAM